METTQMKTAINQEIRKISRCAGYRMSKYSLLVLLCFLYFPTKGTSAYLSLFVFFFPFALSYLLGQGKSQAADHILESAVRHYRYSPTGYRAERYNSSLVIIFLLLWQMGMRNSTEPLPIVLAPAISLAIYLAVQIISTIYIRCRIRKTYGELWLLS